MGPSSTDASANAPREGTMISNPFGVKNPEDQSPEYIVQNFVDMFTDFGKVREPENTFVHGARGTGKSMMMRSLETPVMLYQPETRRLQDLRHLGVHVPLRRVEFSIPELEMLKGAASVALGEHLLVMYCMFRLVISFKGLLQAEEVGHAESLTKTFIDLLKA